MQILSKRLDMKDLLKPQNRERLFHKLLDRLVFAFPSGGHVSSKRKKYTLAIEYREEPWYHMTHLSPAGYYLTVTAYMVEPPPWEAPWGEEEEETLTEQGKKFQKYNYGKKKREEENKERLDSMYKKNPLKNRKRPKAGRPNAPGGKNGKGGKAGGGG